MTYSPGTKAFVPAYDYWDPTVTRDSNLPCSLVFVPDIWSNLIWLSDYISSSLFQTTTMENFVIFKDLIRCLLRECIKLTLPADIQKKVFLITNRIILKASKYLMLLENQGDITFKEMSTSEKFNILGIDEFTMIQLIKNINECNLNSSSDKIFSSAYVVEGVEIILSILSIINESYISLENYFRDTFEYTLPLWIEAIIKLGQFLNFFQGTSVLESQLLHDINSELKLNDEIKNIFIISNVALEIENSLILDQIEKTLVSHNAKIYDKNKDIQIISDQKTNTKSIFILVDGYNIENLKEVVEEAKQDNDEREMWKCADANCQFENDPDNTNCCICDAPKKIKPKKTKKSSLIKMESYNYTVNDIVENLKINFKNNKEISTFETKDEVELTSEEIKKIEDEKLKEELSKETAKKKIEEDKKKKEEEEESKKKEIEQKKKDLEEYKKQLEEIKKNEENKKIDESKEHLKNEEQIIKNKIDELQKIYDLALNTIESNSPAIRLVNNIEIPNQNSNLMATEQMIDTTKVKQEPIVEEKLERHPNLPKPGFKIQVTKHKNDIKVVHLGDLKSNYNSVNDILNDFLRIRLALYISSEKNYFEDKFKALIKDNYIKKNLKNELEIINNLIEHFKKDKESFVDAFKQNSIKEFSDLNLLTFYKNLEEKGGVDLWLDQVLIFDQNFKNSVSDIKLMEKIRELVDIMICKETKLSYVIPSKNFRFVPDYFDNLNHTNNSLLENYSKELFNVPLSVIRYLWSIIKYFNNCLFTALPFIKPPDSYTSANPSNDPELVQIPFPKSISDFLSSAKGISFSITKQNLIKEVMSSTEYSEQEIQIPTFKFERLKILNTLEGSNKKGTLIIYN